MHSTRKRRAASLTAEALWAIQMDDASHSKSTGSIKETMTKRSSANTSKYLSKKRRKDSQVEKSDSTKKAPGSITTKRQSMNLSDKKKSTDISLATPKTKPTASVIPVKKNVDSTEWRGSNISLALENPHVLLLPVSVNDVQVASVPVLAFPPSMNLKLVKNCFGSSSSPVVNVRSLFQHHPPELLHRVSRGIRPIECNSSTDLSQSSGRLDKTGSDSQTEPLNLKLGESTIPSIKTSVHDNAKEFKHYCSNVTGVNVLRKEKTKGLVLNKISENLQQKLMSKILDDRLEAYSPSSESSYSSEPETATSCRSRPRRRSINLRTKAAKSDEYEVPQQGGQSSENNSWTWEGKAYNATVYSVKSGRPVLRRCYPSMRRKSDNTKSAPDEVVMIRDCVAMRAHGGEQPYIAKVVAMWEDTSGNMMISLLWYYRPEHTEDPKVATQTYCSHELFASRHLDEISVACIEEKCYVLTYTEYCRYRASDSGREESTVIQDNRQIVPVMGKKPRRNIPVDIDCSLVFYSRRYYDIKSNRLLKQFPNPTALYLRDHGREDKNSAVSTAKGTK